MQAISRVNPRIIEQTNVKLIVWCTLEREKEKERESSRYQNVSRKKREEAMYQTAE